MRRMGAKFLLPNSYQFRVIGGIRPSEVRFPEYSDSTNSSVSKILSEDVAIVYPPNARIQLRRPTVVSNLSLDLRIAGYTLE